MVSIIQLRHQLLSTFPKARLFQWACGCQWRLSSLAPVLRQGVPAARVIVKVSVKLTSLQGMSQWEGKSIMFSEHSEDQPPAYSCASLAGSVQNMAVSQPFAFMMP